MTRPVIFGCPVANRAWVLPQWWEAIQRQTVRPWKAAFVYTESDDATFDMISTMGAVIDGGVSPRTQEDMDAHRWPLAHVERMAEWRNMLLDYCIEQGAEWFFSVDSDIILPPKAFKDLAQPMENVYLHHGYKACAPLVNMAGHLDPGTFAYNYMDWQDPGAIVAAAYRSGVPLKEERFRTGVIMAAMLIHRSAFHIKWSGHEQGEDIGWSWHAAQQGIKVFIDPNVVCNHPMRRPL